MHAHNFRHNGAWQQTCSPFKAVSHRVRSGMAEAHTRIARPAGALEAAARVDAGRVGRAAGRPAHALVDVHVARRALKPAQCREALGARVTRLHHACKHAVQTRLAQTETAPEHASVCQSCSLHKRARICSPARATSCPRPQASPPRAGTDRARHAERDSAARPGARTRCRAGRPHAWWSSRPRRRAPRARTRCSARQAGRRARQGTRPRRRSGRWWRPWCRCRTCRGAVAVVCSGLCRLGRVR